MSLFGDYKAYKNYEPLYSGWKLNRDIQEAKRQEYFRLNPDKINEQDIQCGKVLIRAIDVMDEYSQKRAEDMEVATETAVGEALNLAMLAGVGIGLAAGNTKSVKSFLQKHFGKGTASTYITQIIPSVAGALVSMVAAFPLFAWAAKAEVSASRKGRFEAMRKDLSNPNGFAILSEEQIEVAKRKAGSINLEKEKKSHSFANGFKTLREMATDTKEYKTHKKMFDLELREAEKHFNDEMTAEEIENSKKEQQLLTKLVEKIDIASQDYAENTELALQMITGSLIAMGGLFNLGLQKGLSLLKVKSAAKIAAVTQIAAISIPIIFSIASAQIQKQASRVGRFKIKQELLNNPSKLAYVADNDIENIDVFHVDKYEKEPLITFLKKIWKNNKEYNKYKKTTAKDEERFYKAVETLDLTDKQRKNAETLQRNTFKTFNKVDEMSQKYAESIEALGQSLSLPISLIFTALGLAVGGKYLTRCGNSKTKAEMLSNLSKYVSVVMMSMVPSIAINFYITKEQKKASRIADMLAIKEMDDYRHFR